jgi:hypothetical protein
MSSALPRIPVFLNPTGRNEPVLQVDASVFNLQFLAFSKKQDALTREKQIHSQDTLIRQSADSGPYYGAIGGGYTYEVTFHPSHVLVEIVHVNKNRKALLGHALRVNKALLTSTVGIYGTEAANLAKHPYGSQKTRWWTIEEALSPKYTYCSTPTGLGAITIVRFNEHDKFELNITDFDSW